jgi:endoglucanase
MRLVSVCGSVAVGAVLTVCMPVTGSGQNLKLNDREYFEGTGLNVLVFSGQYNGFFFDEKTAGIEMVHHGVRTATGGAVRLNPAPEQWDLIPEMTARTVDRKDNAIDVTLRYKDYDFDSRVTVTAEGSGVRIRVSLDKPLPERLAGHAGFNLEFLPSAYFEKTFFMDGKGGVFPIHPVSTTVVKPAREVIPQFNGYSTYDDRGRGEFIEPRPIATGKTLVLAPEDPERYVRIRSTAGDLELYDGRIMAQNGWFVVRTEIPAQKTGTVVEWFVEPNMSASWKRKPVIGFSQAGYHPAQKKVAVIELDKNDPALSTASVVVVTPDGKTAVKFSSEVRAWGNYLRYNYATFDFTDVKDSGLYFIRYGDQQTQTFRIGEDVFDDIWYPTLDVWFPVQMDHMLVREGYRVWHGLPFRDDALQAPPNLRHFDGYWTDSTTNTQYKPLERIPGLDVGGWFDAGDFDIETEHHCSVIQSFVDTWETFGATRDETLVDQRTRYVGMHHPDGKPDLLQQIEHGALQLVAQQKNVGFAVRGINFPKLHQYPHLGDGSTLTDNLPFNPSLKPYESDGVSSGTLDDRWVFTPRMPQLNLSAAGALAAASRALKGFNDELSGEALKYALQAWTREQNDKRPVDNRWAAWFLTNAECNAALQLYVTTGDQKYRTRFEELIWTQLDSALAWNITTAAQAVPHLPAGYKAKLEPYVRRYRELLTSLGTENPYGVPIGRRGWAGNSELISWSIANYYLHRSFPEIIGKEYVYRALDYVLGCHPYSNISFVAGVGTHAKKRVYGSNRADFSFIAGGVVPGVLLIKPDLLENMEDWPFLWGENECVIDICADYIFLAHAQRALLNGKEQ